MTQDKYTEIGMLLAQARTDIPLSIEEASQMLHIRVRYLEALEEGRLELIPSPVYAKGYLQRYTNFLHLDGDEIMRRFEEVAGLSARGFYLPKNLAKDKAPSRSVLLGSVVVACLVYVCWWAAVKPPNASLSAVEPWAEKTSLSASVLDNVACLRPPKALYPPCYWTEEPDMDMLPFYRQPKTIMELAY